jgi:flavin reductase (DIM6/NTAB) family NADH-FMN oxidoreductase RutF
MDRNKPLYAALGRIPSGLFIVTARQGDQETGLLASWVQQCSFEPPQLTLAVRHGRGVNDWLTDGAPFTVNILTEEQTDMIAQFGRGFGPGESPFDGVDIDRPGGAAPVLTEALAWLECRVAGRLQAGDHDVIVGTVVAGGVLHEDSPMVHVRKNGAHY